MNLAQVRVFVVREALKRLEPVIPWSQVAENLVFGTGLVESGYAALDQGTAEHPGPAYGFWQMEEPTYEDIWKNFVPGVHGLRAALLDIGGFGSADHPPIIELHGNIFYAAALCRVRYFRAKPPLPAADDAQGLAEYWKQNYNTPLGAGTVERALFFFKQAVNV